MSKVKRFRADHRHVVETEFDDAQFVGVADFDRVTAERDALQVLLTAADDRADVLEADKRRLDLWQNNPGYFGGFAPSGDWSFFNPAGKTCYGKSLRDALDQLGVMDADLKSRR